MSDLEVRIVELEPMRVASFHAFSSHPEGDAWEKLAAWAGPKGYLADLKNHRVFGFNNPDPSPGSPNYGYEFWMAIGPEEGTEGISVKQFDGGLYAVARCDTCGPEGKGITARWKELVAWQQRSKYRYARHQWLEEHISGGDVESLVLDLYMPIA